MKLRQAVRIIRIRRGLHIAPAAVASARCHRCEVDVTLLTPVAAADLLAIPEAQLQGLVQAGAAHVVDTIAGPRICKASLFPAHDGPVERTTEE